MHGNIHMGGKAFLRIPRTVGMGMQGCIFCLSHLWFSHLFLLQDHFFTSSDLYTETSKLQFLLQTFPQLPRSSTQCFTYTSGSTCFILKWSFFLIPTVYKYPCHIPLSCFPNPDLKYLTPLFYPLSETFIFITFILFSTFCHLNIRPQDLDYCNKPLTHPVSSPASPGDHKLYEPQLLSHSFFLRDLWSL